MTPAITLDHGSGGRASHELITRLFRAAFDNAILAPLEDAAVLDFPGKRLAFSTDSFVVDPIFFPGGDIGDLAVNGTVNDLAMRGARPRFLTVGFILEEGLALHDLERIVRSMKRAADAAGVSIVAGDTKVVPAGKADKIFINTSGIGVLEEGIALSAANARPGDAVILSGTMADHGVTILCQQEGLGIGGEFQSDTAAVSGLALKVLARLGNRVRTFRDPTRGGVATTMNEIAQAAGVGIRLFETELPVRPAVTGACELLGLDPLYLANEGKFLAIVEAGAADEAVAIMREDPLGAEARVLGRVVAEHPGRVVLETRIGTARVVDMLSGHPLPRIC